MGKKKKKKALQEIVDRQEIHDVLLRYCRGIDRLDVDLAGSAFHDDAEVIYSTFTAVGKDVGPSILNTTKHTSGHKMAVHHITNHLVHLEGDVANSETYFLMYGLSESEDPERLDERGGRYLDRFERRDGVWRIAKRQVIWDWRRTTEMPVPFRELAGNTIGHRSTEDASYQFIPKLL